MNPIEFMKNYAAWREETQKELDKWLNDNGDQGREWSFGEDGTIIGKYFVGNRENTFQRSYPKFKVTAWKDSKYYYEM